MVGPHESPDPARAAPRRGRVRRWAGRALLAGAALVVALAIVETVLRTFDLFGVNYPVESLRYRTELLRPGTQRPDGSIDPLGTVFRHRPNAVVRFGHFTVRTNSLGFRGPEIAKEKPAGTFRILMLGDSVVFGWGVDDEVTFARRLEAELNARRDGRRYEVVNTGHPMYDTTQEAALLAEEGLALDPDLVILVYVVNDVEPTALLVEEAFAAAKQGGDAPAGGVLASLGATVRGWLRATTTLLETVRLGRSAPGPRDGASVRLEPKMIRHGEEGWRRSRAALRRIRDLCEERGIPFLVLDHTLPPLDVLVDFCKAEGIARYDFRFTPQELGADIYNSLVDSHANAKGHEILLRRLRDVLARTGVLDRR